MIPKTDARHREQKTRDAPPDGFATSREGQALSDTWEKFVEESPESDSKTLTIKTVTKWRNDFNINNTSPFYFLERLFLLELTDKKLLGIKTT